MFKKVMLLGAVVASALAVTSAAFAGGGNSQNAREAAACVQAGIGTLVSLGLIDEAARGQIDYDALDLRPLRLAKRPTGPAASNGLCSTLSSLRTAA